MKQAEGEAGGGSSSWVINALETINKVSTVVGSNAGIIKETIRITPNIGYIIAYSPKLMKASKVVGFLEIESYKLSSATNGKDALKGAFTRNFDELRQVNFLCK